VRVRGVSLAHFKKVPPWTLVETRVSWNSEQDKKKEDLSFVALTINGAKFFTSRLNKIEAGKKKRFLVGSSDVFNVVEPLFN
jgi:hypothetical protein